jgi:hypothetical protein
MTAQHTRTCWLACKGLVLGIERRQAVAAMSSCRRGPLSLAASLRPAMQAHDDQQSAYIGKTAAAS